jgi:H+/Cl- antiporter ClcA
MVGACGSFAAVSTLLGSPLTGAFLMMEASGLGGARATMVLVPGLLAAGLGSMVFVGLNSWTGLGAFSLTIPDLPRFGSPSLMEFAWAIAIGIGAAVTGTVIRYGALLLRSPVQRNLLFLTPTMGVTVAIVAVVYTQVTGHSYSDVLFSGQDALPRLVGNSDSYSVGALALLIASKSLAYCASLSAFRGGPIFPALFIGAAAGIGLSHLGLSQTAGIAMGMGAMSAAMLRLPLTSTLLASLLMASSGPNTIPLVIVAVVVAFVAAVRLAPQQAAGESGYVHAPARG